MGCGVIRWRGPPDPPNGAGGNAGRSRRMGPFVNIRRKNAGSTLLISPHPQSRRGNLLRESRLLLKDLKNLFRKSRTFAQRFLQSLFLPARDPLFPSRGHGGTFRFCPRLASRDRSRLACLP